MPQQPHNEDNEDNEEYGKSLRCVDCRRSTVDAIVNCEQTKKKNKRESVTFSEAIHRATQ